MPLDGNSPMTGILTTPGVIVDSGSQFANMSQKGSGGYKVDTSIDTEAGTVYHTVYNSSNAVVGGIMIAQNSFLPRSNGDKSLGDSAYRWRDIYITNSPIVGSDRRIKKEISPLETQMILCFLQHLTPVQYKYIDGSSGRTHFGFIAQEVEDAMSGAGLTSMDFAGLIKSPVLDQDGNETGDFIYALRQEEFISALVKGWQNHEERIMALEKRG